MGAIRVRPAGLADAGAIGALHVASWRETYGGILPEAMLAALSPGERAEMWRSVIADPHAFGDAAVLVAETQDGTVAGFGSCAAQRDAALAAAGFSGEIGALYVLRTHQGRGVGRALFASLAGALAERGHGAASLWVLRDNAPARAFYERLGGKVVGERSEEGAEGRTAEVAYGWPDLSRLARPHRTWPEERG